MLRAQRFLETLVQLLALPAEEDEEDDEEDEEDIVTDYLDKLRLVLELLVLVASTFSSRGRDLFLREQDEGSAGVGIRLPVDSVVALCACMLPVAAPPSTGRLPSDVLCKYLKILQVLAQDSVNQDHLRAAETRQHIEHYCSDGDDSSCSEERAGFQEFLRSLQ